MGLSVSALAGTVAAPFAARRGGFDAMRWLRSGLSLALALAILAIALPLAFNSGARGAGVDPVQVFSSGSAVAVDASGGVHLSAEGLIPGQGRTGTIRVSNAGSGASSILLAAHFADRVAPGGAPLSSVLDLRIASSSGATLYRGTLAGLGRLSLGRIEAGLTRAFDFIVSLPRSVGNEVEGSKLRAGFSWTAS
jgi:hypothetical protein